MSTTAVLSVVGVGLAAYLVGVLLWATARFFTSQRKPSYATTHRYEELHQLAGAACAKHTEIGRKPPTSCATRHACLAAPSTLRCSCTGRDDRARRPAK